MRINNDCWLVNTPIAHRGLWNDSIVENSMTAYKNAVEFSLPIEIDLYLTKDEQIVCFHDETLDRMTGVSANVWNFTYDQLSKLSLAGSNEKIPLFKDVLALCCGKSPLLIELKNQPNNKIVEKTLELLSNYKGEFAIQSFNPLYINKVKKLRPDVIRGILSTDNDVHLKKQGKIKAFLIKNMALNFLVKPDFISYEYTGYPKILRKCKGKIKIAWTITDDNTYQNIISYVDNIIFEKFLPKSLEQKQK